jgi:hypothetical protein
VEKARFEKAIKDAIKARRQRLEEKNNLMIEPRVCPSPPGLHQLLK